MPTISHVTDAQGRTLFTGMTLCSKTTTLYQMWYHQLYDSLLWSKVVFVYALSCSDVTYADVIDMWHKLYVRLSLLGGCRAGDLRVMGSNLVQLVSKSSEWEGQAKLWHPDTFTYGSSHLCSIGNWDCSGMYQAIDHWQKCTVPLNHRRCHFRHQVVLIVTMTSLTM